MNRKEFLKSCGLTCAGITISSVIMQGCSSSVYIAKSYKDANRLVVLKSEFLLSDNTNFRKYVIIQSHDYSFPICIFKNKEEYTALLMECTHKSCELQPQGTFLVCPCHGSEFTSKGVVQNPPAEENLKVFPITTDNEKIYIQL